MGILFLLDCEESLLLLDSVVWYDLSELVLDPIPIQSLSESVPNDDWGVVSFWLDFFILSLIRVNCSEKLLNIEAKCSNPIAGDGVEVVGGGVEVSIEE